MKQSIVSPRSSSKLLVALPAKSAALSTVLLDVTNRRDRDPRIPYLDPLKSIRDRMTRLERSLGEACLLDANWCIRGDGRWRERVERSASIQELALLLVSLADACCQRSFLPEWYRKENLNSGGVHGIRSPSLSDEDYAKESSSSAISEDWTPTLEILRRKWDRCLGNEILRLFGADGELLRRAPPTGKRGMKSRKTRDGSNLMTKQFKDAADTTGASSTTVSKETAEGVKGKQQVSSLPASGAKGRTNDENDRSLVNGSKAPSLSRVVNAATCADKPIDKATPQVNSEKLTSESLAKVQDVPSPKASPKEGETKVTTIMGGRPEKAR